ncbi:MAG: hypothetical protein AB8F65_12600 [Woeseiaceae bacterium]
MRFRLVLLTMSLLLATHANAESLYESETPLAVTLNAPLTSISRAKDSEENPYFDSRFELGDANGASSDFFVGVRARGNFRRANCRFLPLQLNFKKSEVKDTYLTGQDKLKLVSACRPGQQFRNWMMLEYLSYKAWALISDYHFRTQLLDVTYVDTDSGKSRQALAFIIEDDGDTAKRLSGGLLKASQGRASINEEHAALYELFQFFIGNNDYSLTKSGPGRPCCHNSRIVDTQAAGHGLVPIPYDFDHAGIVDAKYARPPDHLMDKIQTVKQRYFTGVCKSSDQVWLSALERFKSQREALRAVYDDPRLGNRFKRNATKYVDQFFDIADDPAKVKRFILDRCRGAKPQGKS